MAPVREIAVFAEAAGGLAEAQVASVREIAVFADVQVALRPEDSERPRSFHSNANLYISIFKFAFEWELRAGSGSPGAGAT